MKLPFVIISRAEYEELQRCWRTDADAQYAYRWLSEFDWLLAPFWDWLLNKQSRFGNGISDVRDEMRKAKIGGSDV